MNRAKESFVFAGFALGVSLAGPVSCGLTDETPLGKRVEHPAPRSPSLPRSADSAEEASPAPPEETFSPLDEALANDCHFGPGKGLSRAWSQHVPERDCTDDSECGDGYCNRGRCAAIWTCLDRSGQRCIDGRAAPSSRFRSRRCPGLCLDGRCRSCVSDEECIQALGASDAGCSGEEESGMRSCGLLAPTFYRPVPSRP
jgi:hypothetical protein